MQRVRGGCMRGDGRAEDASVVTIWGPLGCLQNCSSGGAVGPWAWRRSTLARVPGHALLAVGMLLFWPVRRRGTLVPNPRKISDENTPDHGAGNGPQKVAEEIHERSPEGSTKGRPRDP